MGRRNAQGQAPDSRAAWQEEIVARIAFVGTFAGRMVEPVKAQLSGDHEVIVGDEAGIVPRLGDVDIVVSMVVTPDMARAARKVKAVLVPGAGVDRVARGELPAGTLLANAYGHEAGIAEFVIGAMLTLTRDLARIDASLRRGAWESQWAIGTPPPLWPELAGKTLGILGYGRIGRAVAKRAQAFDMDVHAIRRDPAASASDEFATVTGPESLDDLLGRADYLALTLALTEETRGLIGVREFGLMKPTAMLINVARGPVVDQAALYRALKDGTIAAAAIDVWYRYPSAAGVTMPADQPFHELPNILMTPHASGWTEGMLRARVAVIAENIARAAAGQPLINPVP